MEEGGCVCATETGGEGGTDAAENVQNGHGAELAKGTGGKAETALNASTR